MPARTMFFATSEAKPRKWTNSTEAVFMLLFDPVSERVMRCLRSRVPVLGFNAP